ncbi:hypothetical protein [Mycoplasma leonicaptivi]|uniref:hypothetical protein n=1 Tax=Mycoplasma leonicaptivi TaxID=36742 RepID=UPI000482D8B9|nr:hypothetical protein [Mycoplasma leonicaptivi]
MKKTLDYESFAVVKTTHISSEDLHNLRQFYGPVIGSTGVFLYEYLLDLCKNKTSVTVEFPFSTLCIYMNMHENDLNKARREIEGLGLINTYKNDLKTMTFFRIHKPLNYDGLAKNPFVSNLIIQKIGLTNFNRMLNSRKPDFDNCSTNDFEDVSTNFFEIFDKNDDQEKQTIKNHFISLGNKEVNPVELHTISNKLNLRVPLQFGSVKFSNEYEAVLKLNNYEFFEQLSGEKITDFDKNNIEKWKNALQDSFALNYVMLIARKRRKTNTWIKLIDSMIKELTSQNIFSFSDVETYINGMLRSNSNTKNVYEQIVLLKNSYLGK